MESQPQNPEFRNNPKIFTHYKSLNQAPNIYQPSMRWIQMTGTEGSSPVYTCVLDGDSLASTNSSSSPSVLGGLYANTPLSSAAFIS